MLARTTHPLSDLAASIREGCPAITSSLYTPREWSSAAWAAHDDEDWSDLEHMVAKVATPGDYKPDLYALWQPSTGRFYSFVPHNGLTRCETLEEAMSW
jgi:hypothetical protein